MVNTGSKSRDKTGLIVAALLIAFLLFNCVEIKASSDMQTAAQCDYKTFLDDPAEKARYLEMRQEMELIARIRTDNLAKSDSVWTLAAAGNIRELDENSRECIACHEMKGKSANEDMNIPGHPGMAAISATHGIGTDYVTAKAKKANLRDIEELPPGMTLVNGRIACITCHNPLNSQRFSLAVDNSKTPLCLACHRI